MDIKRVKLSSVFCCNPLGRISAAVCLTVFFIVTIKDQVHARDMRSVLVLHSYHQGLVWTDDIMGGIYPVLKSYDPDIEIHIEYMDTKRHFDGFGGPYLQKLFELYRDKYGSMKLDVIISSDDNAFQFLLMHRDELFPGTPVVFCGVNNFQDEMLSGNEGITGVIEFLDQKASIDIALRLHPGADRLAIITDTSTTGEANRKIIEQLSEEYKDRIQFQFIDKENTGLTLPDLLAKLKALKENSIIYYSDFLRSGDTYIVQETAVPQISAASKGPVYTHYDEILGLGVLGGKLVYGASHGQKAAEMAVQILQGTPEGSIPVYKESINQIMFDYQQLKRFNIGLDGLPEGSIFINRPFSFYRRYKAAVWTASGVLAIMAVSLIAITANVLKRKRAEGNLKAAYEELEDRVAERTEQLKKANEHLKTNEEQFRGAFQYSSIGIGLLSPEGEFLTVNPTLCKITGYSEQEMLSLRFQDITHPDDLETDLENVRKILAGEIQFFHMEKRYIHKKGHIVWVLLSVSLVRDDKGNPLHFVAQIQDITQRKQAEEQLRESLKEKEVLLQEIHHRVKNNLTVIHSLLELQSKYARDSRYRDMFTESMNRIKSMAFIHEKLYQSRDLARIDFRSYVEDVVERLFQSYGLHSDSVSLINHVGPVLFGIDDAIPCGLIINELVTNSIKHAFPGGRKGEIMVGLRMNDEGEYQLSVRDNGIGIPEDFDPTKTDTLGLNLVSALVRQLRGTIETRTDRGAEFVITFRGRE